MHISRIPLALSLIALPAAAAAQELPEMISAADPAAMARIMVSGGFPAVTGIDDYGAPVIDTQFDNWLGRVVFYGCDEEAAENCDSVRLSVGYDLDQAITLDRAASLFGDERFMSVSLDEEGDIFIGWDIYLGGGIPASVFIRSLELFADQARFVGARVFLEVPAAED